ncbi:MAG: DUF2156 domain-containing protein [Deltaproteobacteria bacterium]|nr:DUF2156 domain-containing protein [Deltaproteobacteria bacterium]
MHAPAPVASPDDRTRVLALLRRHGHATVAFQALEADFRYWFDGDDAVVAYVDTGRAWVAGGEPIAAPERLREVADRFVLAARAARRRASFFGCEQRFVDATAWPAIVLGEQPVWQPGAWDHTLATTPSLRYQLRRARKKGVTVRALRPDEVAPGSPLRPVIAALGAEWLAARRMAPMGFLVQLEPLTYPAERVMIVAERGGAVVGFLSAIPVHARRRLFIEDVLRGRAAPNGTSELMIDAAMRAAADLEGVTLGLAPLAGDVPAPLRLARALSTPLYDFRGLAAFKHKLRPDRWEPIYLAAPRWAWWALGDGLTAFARGSLIRFGLQTLAHRPGLRLLAIAAALVTAIAVAVLIATLV